MKAPRDGIQRLAGSFPSTLYKITGNLYGFCNAPRTWTNHVTNILLNKVKLKRHKLEHMMFQGTDKDGLLEVAVIVHVDDFLAVFRQDYQEQNLLQHFTWGSQSYLTEESPIIFRGKEINLVRENDLLVIKVTQMAFIKELTPGALPRGRLTGAETLSAAEWKEYRSCAGSLQWLSGQTRPDVCSTVSLSDKGMDTPPKELQALYQCIDMVRNTSDIGIIYFPIGFDRAMHLVAYGDSSWANAHQSKSQMGIVILCCSPACLDWTTRASLLDWKSTRSPRVTRSTLAAEANAMDEAVDRCCYINAYITELLYDQKEPLGARLLKQLQVTDCRSLYDAVLAPNPVLSEKRTVIQVRSIQEYVQGKDLRWTPTTVMWADGLTKSAPELLSLFQAWLRRPVCTLVAKENKDQCEF